MRKTFLGLAAFAIAIATVPMFAAFEAHVINVTAKIENALSVPLDEIDFGTVFPQEELYKDFGISLSQSFLDENRVDDVDYIIRQKPKCGVTTLDGRELVLGSTATGHVIPDGQGGYTVDCGESPVAFDSGTHKYGMLPLLCPYLSKHPDGVNDAGAQVNNDGSLDAFHVPFTVSSSTVNWLSVPGHLAKSEGDTTDNWTLDLKTPCFGDHCAQDWEEFVTRINPNALPASQWIQAIENEHKVFGCDLWIEVNGISLPGLGCKEEIDLMLVLDRSGSIDSTELQTLKDAANAFVTALGPSTDGNHIGQSSFSTTGSLDLHLTGVEADVHTAINALSSDGFTNLFEGIDLATAELDNAHEHERAAVPDFMVIITDGNPNRPGTDDPTDNSADEAAAAAAADAARAAGIEVFVVGVGSDLDATYLSTEIADDAGHYFDAALFEDLEAVLAGLTQCEPS